jgi:putative glutamine amidotransferase
MTPRIAIPLPTSFDSAYNRLNFAAYMDAVRECGGEPIEVALDSTTRELCRLAAECDAILLPGSPADVSPAKYGQSADEATAPADERREAVDQFLLEDAWRVYKPVLGICFGTQMLNVWRGGTLVQDLAPQPVPHSAGRAVAIAHTASILPGSLLAGIVDPEECTLVEDYPRLPVNSSHHQAVGIAAGDLVISARCPQDGVVEAIESAEPGRFVLGVQWHPERTFQSSSTSRALFERFVAEARTSAIRTRRPVTVAG